MQEIVVSSTLSVRPEQVWNEQSFATVNDELGPWIQMSAPAAWRSFKVKDWRGDGQLFKSWVLLLGVLPIDRHLFGTLEVGTGMGYVESSSSWLLRAWRHERSVRALPGPSGGCEVTDRLNITPRLPFAAALVRPIYMLVFRHRHARLRARWARETGSAAQA